VQHIHEPAGTVTHHQAEPDLVGMERTPAERLLDVCKCIVQREVREKQRKVNCVIFYCKRRTSCLFNWDCLDILYCIFV